MAVDSASEGIHLAQMVKTRGPLDVAKVIDYLLQALDALCEAHAAGIVHRDINPRNLLLTSGGKVTVLDLTETRTAGATMMESTPHFMSPEQIGAPETVDVRSDLWSLGATAFFLLTARPPFEGENVYVLTTKILVEDAPRVRTFRPAIAARLDQIVARCLKRDLHERFQTAAQLRDALASLERDLSRRFDATLKSPEEEAAARAGLTAAIPVEIVQLPKFTTTERMDTAPVDDGPTELSPLDEGVLAAMKSSGGERDDAAGKGGTLIMPTPRAMVPASGSASRPLAPPLAPTQPRSGHWRVVVIVIALAAGAAVIAALLRYLR